MLDRSGLLPIIVAALKSSEGTARMRDIAKYIWDHHEKELRQSGEFFYVWQYDLRWAGDALVRQRVIRKGPPAGTWHLL